jgi:HK97 gp10 family phage protein
MAETMRLIGLESLQALLRTEPARVRSAVSRVIATTAFSLTQRARASVPVDTGALQASLRSYASGMTGGVVVESGFIRGRQPEVYWRFVEYGTVRVPARPFLRAAAESELPTFEARIRSLASDIERDLSLSRAA